MKQILVLVMLVVLLTGCAGPEGEVTATETVVPPAPVISASGKVVPERWASLTVQTGGVIQEVLVQVGDPVPAGAVLLRLDDTEARLAVQQAEAALAAAQAQRARLQAGTRPEAIAVAEAQVRAAEAAVAQASAQRQQLKAGATEAEIAAAQAQLAEAQAREWAARDLYNREGWAMGDAATTQLRAAEAARAAAEAQLAQVQGGATAEGRAADATVWGAVAQKEVAQAQLALLQAPATPEELAVAEAAVQQAEAALAVARTALVRTELRAPFAGTVGAVFVHQGELLTPGQPALIIGDLSTLRVETTDLSELDVARLQPGQTVVVTFDALPDLSLPGTVARLAPMSTPGQSAVNYQVVVELAQLDPGLRWGMTAFVDIQWQP